MLTRLKAPLMRVIASMGTSVAPMCCVIAPSSVDVTDEPRILSRSDVLPWSTWPITQTMGVLIVDLFAMTITFLYVEYR